MKKTWFDVRLFRDAMHQLRVGGLVAGLVLVLQAILIPIGEVVSGPRVSHGWSLVGMMHINPMSLGLFCVIAPLMALYLFRFLSQRSASDFYHSIPQTRVCLYVSFVAAVLCWAVLLQVVSTAVGVGMHLIFPSWFHVDFRSILLFNVQLFAAILFVVGAVMLAVTLTGNPLTNLAVSLLIIFFPRLIMLVVKECVGSSLTIVNGEYLSFLGNDWNVVTGTVFSFLVTSQSLFLSLRAGAYTAVLGIFYLILGGVMFERRKSEGAGEASIHPGLQLFFRLLPAAVFCLIPNVRVFQMLAGSGERLTAETCYILFVLYLIGVFLYFMYELISTRKVKNLPRAIPGLVLLAGFNLLVIFGMLGLRRNLMSFQPEAGEIESVRIIGKTLYVWDGEDGDVLPGYLSTRVSKLELTDEKAKEVVALRLRETIAFDELPEEERDYESVWTNTEVAIRSHGKVHYRILRLLQSDLQGLAEALKNDSRIQEIYMDLPEGSSPNVKLAVNDDAYNGIYYEPSAGHLTLSEEELASIFDAMKEDARDMGFENWYAYCTNPPGSEFTLYMKVSEEGEDTGSAFPLTENTPKALEACVRAMMQEQSDLREEAIQFTEKYLEQLEDSNAEYYDCSVVLHPTHPKSIEDPVDYYSVDLHDRTQVEELLQLIKEQKNRTLDMEQGYMEVNLSAEYTLIKEGEETANMVNASDHYYRYSAVLLFPMPEGGKAGGLERMDEKSIEDLTDLLQETEAD